MSGAPPANKVKGREADADGGDADDESSSSTEGWVVGGGGAPPPLLRVGGADAVAGAIEGVGRQGGRGILSARSARSGCASLAVSSHDPDRCTELEPAATDDCGSP